MTDIYPLILGRLFPIHAVMDLSIQQVFFKHTLYARQCAEPVIRVLNKAEGGPTFVLHQLRPRAKEKI